MKQLERYIFTYSILYNRILSQCLLDQAPEKLEPVIGAFQAGQKIYTENIFCTFLYFKKENQKYCNDKKTHSLVPSTITLQQTYE